MSTKKTKYKSADYTVFLDAIGIREAYHLETPDYKSRLAALYNAVITVLRGDSKEKYRGIHCWVVSDSIVLAGDNLHQMAEAIAEIRVFSMLGEPPLFLKGSLFRNEANEPLISAVTVGEEHGITRVTFGKTTVKAFLEEERFKGIGISVKVDITEHLKDDIFVKSLSFQEPSKPTTFCDLNCGFRNKDAYKSGILDIILKQFYYSKIKSRKFEHNYTTLLCTWLGGIRKEDIREKHDNGALLFFDRLSKGFFEKKFGAVEGRFYIYFAALKTIFETYQNKLESAPEEIRKSMVFLGTQQTLDPLIDSLPPEYFSRELKERFIKLRIRAAFED